MQKNTNKKKQSTKFLKTTLLKFEEMLFKNIP